MEQITRKAYAKINLVLDVTGRLPNGYHEVSMVMQNVGIHDTLTFTKREDDQIVLTTNDGQLPLGEDNLIYKAVLLLRELTGNKDGVTIHLEKRIPVAAGMAGGSTDAAATLLGVNELLCLGLQKKQLQKESVRIGADVPYCVLGKTAHARGIGEKIILEHEETYGEHFLVPQPDELVFISWFSGGEVFRSGCLYCRGNGKIFYFQPGHETSPNYHNPYVQKIIDQGIHWAAPTIWRPDFDCPNSLTKPEEK